MGKSKKGRQKGDRHHPIGEQLARPEEELGDRWNSTITSLLEKLQSVSAEERECACSTTAALVEQDDAVTQLLSADVGRVLAPLMLDPSQSVRETAAGALRNLSVAGGCEGCEAMIKQDVMTPLCQLFKQHDMSAAASVQTIKGEATFEAAARHINGNEFQDPVGVDGLQQGVSDSSAGEQLQDPRIIVLTQATHLLWNLGESCDGAVKKFNAQQLLLNMLPHCNANVYGSELAVATAQCLYTLTEDNPDAVSLAWKDGGQMMASLHRLIVIDCDHDNLPKHLLLNTLIAGILYNLSNGSLEWLTNVSTVLTKTLAYEIGKILSNLEEQMRLCHMSTDNSDQSKLLKQLLEMACNVCLAHQVALEIFTNMCSSQDSGDVEEWEEKETEEEGSGDAALHDMEMEEPNMDDRGLSEDVKQAIGCLDITKLVLNKIEPQELALIESSRVKNELKEVDVFLKKMAEVRNRALFCLNNLVCNLDTVALGGTERLIDIWCKLLKLMTNELAGWTTMLQDNDQTDPLFSSTRSVAEALLKSSPDTLTQIKSEQLALFVSHSQRGSSASVRVNAARIIAVIGCSLSSSNPSSPLVKDIGMNLMGLVGSEPELWAIAEVLDCIIDIFSEDNLDPLFRELDLLQSLKKAVPALKAMLKQQRRNLGEHLELVVTVQENLTGFVKYKSNIT